MAKSQKGLEAQKTLLAYLEQQNRPWNIKGIFENLHGAIGKAEIEKALTKLVEAGSVTQKVFGKQAIFWYAQCQHATLNDEELGELAGAIAAAEAECQSSEELLGKEKRARDGLKLHAPTRDLVQTAKRLRETAERQEAELAEHEEAGTERVDRAAYEARRKQLAAVQTAHAKRRRLYRNVIGTLEEQAQDLSRAELLEKIGICE